MVKSDDILKQYYNKVCIDCGDLAHTLYNGRCLKCFYLFTIKQKKEVDP